MARYVKPDPEQFRFMALNLVDLFGPESREAKHLNLIQQLDLCEFDAKYNNDNNKGGRPAMPPVQVLALITWHILNGGSSMRALQRDMRVRADLMFLAGGLEIDHDTLSKFLIRHRELFAKLLTNTVLLATHAGLVDWDDIAIDSTKVKASANRHDIGTIEQFQERLPLVEEACKRRIKEYSMAESEEEMDWYKKKIKNLERQKAKLQEGIKALESLPKGNRLHLTDPDADWHKDRSDHFMVAYNSHAAVDAKSQIILHTQVERQQSDAPAMQPMISAVEAIRNEIAPGSEPHYLLDSGYASEANLEATKELDIYMPDRSFSDTDKPGNVSATAVSKPAPTPLPAFSFKHNPIANTFTCPAGRTLRFKRAKALRGNSYSEFRTGGCRSCSKREPCAGKRATGRSIWVRTADLPAISNKIYQKTQRVRKVKPTGKHTVSMREKLRSEAGRKIYSRRFCIVEPVFGVITELRAGYDFLRRTLEKVNVDFSIRAIAHNLGKLQHFCRA